MPINIYSVANHLEENHWKLISTEYKNLNTELEMQCPHGHTQFQTYANWRKHMLCEQCMAGDPYRIKDKVPIKKIETFRVLSLDAATGTTGYAIFDDDQLVNYGLFKADKTLETTARINQVKKWLEAAIKEWQPDYIGIENIQLQGLGSHGSYQVETYRALANLQGVLVDTIFEARIDYCLAYSSQWRKYCNISEGERQRDNKKKQAQEKVKLWYQQDCTQDEADAICLGRYVCSYIKNNKSTWGESI